MSSSGATATYWPSGRGVRIDRDAMREVADLVFGQPHVVPRVGLEKIDARDAAPERIAGKTSSHGAHTRSPAAMSRMAASNTRSNLRTMPQMISLS